MAQYIDKSVLVAEIERRIERYSKLQGNGETEIDRIFGMLVEELTEFLSFINTHEVKEVNLDYIKDELDKVVKIYKPDGHFGWGTLYNIAIHFFELGLKVQKGE